MKAKLATLFFFIASATLLAQTGNIRGTVTSNAGPAAGCLVQAVPTDGGNYRGLAEAAADGSFVITKVPVGKYNLEFTMTGFQDYVEENIEVTAGGTVAVTVKLEAPLNIMEVMTVSTASRRPERIVEAPAAVSVITSDELASQTSHGQLPRMLENQPGVEITQSGVYDFNINARGFNSSLNRRILTLVDGRDPAVAFLGNQEWSALAVPLEEFASMELVRGPGSALYGANAFNGVLNIKTKRPSETPGGYVTGSFGELSSYRLDARYAGLFGAGWSYRVSAGTTSSDTWSQSRTAAELNNGIFEYGPLPNQGRPSTPEVRPLDEDPVKSTYFSVRVDKDFFWGHTLSLEAGTAKTKRGDAVTGIGRVQITESERPYFRINYGADHYNVMYWRSDRETPVGQLSLTSGGTLYEDSYNEHAEIQFNYSLFEDQVDIVFGGAYHHQNLDTTNKQALTIGGTTFAPGSVHTLMVGTKDEEQTAAFGQLTWHAGDHFDVVLAGRYDDSSLHDAQKSPKAAVVWKINENHSVRGTFNQAFQTPNFSEFFLRAGATPIPFNLIELGIENAIGVDLPLNWQQVPAMALGNPDLTVEQIETYELGYKGIVGSNLFLTLDYYHSNLTNFVTDLLPGVNPNIEPYIFDDSIPAAVQAILRSTMQGSFGALYNGLSVNTDPTNPFVPLGHPMLTVSYTNAGEVDVDGLDLAFNYYLTPQWTIEGNYSWFDFEVVDPGVEESIVPNAPETKWNLGFTYKAPNYSFGMKYKYTDGFPWAAGIFVGEVPSYGSLGLNGTYDFGDHLRMTLNVINATDDEHIEIYGGSINGRQATASVSYRF
ncbi:MAG: TonB-dependent receptor [Acidobacteria bacterium]|nr:TonB-dependent receptor [Acidobacteriota bacterium]